jgi:hypothetical protein
MGNAQVALAEQRVSLPSKTLQEGFLRRIFEPMVKKLLPIKQEETAELPPVEDQREPVRIILPHFLIRYRLSFNPERLRLVSFA